MERLALSSNKSNLLKLEEELSFAGGGLELLDEKKEALMAHITLLAAKSERVRARLNHAMEEAFERVREALIVHGYPACERASLGVDAGEQIEVREKSFMGVALPVVRISLPEFLPPYGFLGTGASMDAVTGAIHRSLEIVAELAEIEVGLFRLVAEIRKTIKRINALENIYIPVYESTIKHIAESIEEKEREFLFQLKRRKARGEDAEDGAF